MERTIYTSCTLDCPDGCGLPPQFYHPLELAPALEVLTADRQAKKLTAAAR